MYYIRLISTEEDEIEFYCRKCEYVETVDENSPDKIFVSHTQLKKGEQKFNHMINQYTKYDPTLPRLYTMPCPNDNCDSNKGGSSTPNPEVIYIRYDNDNLKFVYLCSECDCVWKTDDKH